jgi:hypothetical protein
LKYKHYGSSCHQGGECGRCIVGVCFYSCGYIESLGCFFYSVDVCEDLLADPVDCVSIFLSPVLFFVVVVMRVSSL